MKELLEILKLDADSFFKRVRPEHILDCLHYVLDDLRANRGLDAVTVFTAKSSTHRGYPGGPLRELRRGKRAISFYEILQVAHYEVQAGVVRLGDRVLLLGYPAQGSSFSEALTDLVTTATEVRLHRAVADLVARKLLPADTVDL